MKTDFPKSVKRRAGFCRTQVGRRALQYCSRRSKQAIQHIRLFESRSSHRILHRHRPEGAVVGLRRSLLAKFHYSKFRDGNSKKQQTVTLFALLRRYCGEIVAIGSCLGTRRGAFAARYFCHTRAEQHPRLGCSRLCQVCQRTVSRRAATACGHHF